MLNRFLSQTRLSKRPQRGSHSTKEDPVRGGAHVLKLFIESSYR